MPQAIVIDDLWMIRDLVRSTLEIKGFEVVTFRSHAEALASGRLAAAGLVVARLDTATPGESTLRALRREGSTARVLVLGVGLPERRVTRARELGAGDYLEVPFGPWTLSDRVDALIRAEPAMICPAADIDSAATDTEKAETWENRQ